MFWMRNKENNFPIRTLIWRPDKILGVFVVGVIMLGIFVRKYHPISGVFCVVLSYAFVTFPYVVLGQVWYLFRLTIFLSSLLCIQPHIDFCNSVWCNSCESNKIKIFKLQKRQCRVIHGYR